MKVDPGSSQYSRVVAMIVDPSCSGSGMVTRLDHLLVRCRRGAAVCVPPLTLRFAPYTQRREPWKFGVVVVPGLD